MNEIITRPKTRSITITTIKAVLTMVSLLVVLTAQAQTRTGNYKSVTIDHWKDGSTSTSTIKRHPGTLNIGRATILIDSAGVKPQAYTIVERSNVQDYWYDDVPAHYGIQFLTLLYPDKKGELKIMKAILMFDKDKRTITDVILKKGKHENITYTF